MEFIENRSQDETDIRQADDDGRSTAYFIGDGTLLIRCAELFLAAGHAISAVITRDRRAAEWARRAGIAIIDKDAFLAAGHRDPPVDFLFSVGNLDVIPSAVLARVRRRAINFHDGPLPRHAGLHATTWAILAGETSHGVTWHQIDETIDTGAILAQEHFDILPGDTVFSLNGRCYEAGASSFAALLDGLVSGRVEARPQRGERLYHGRLKRPARAATLDFRQPRRPDRRPRPRPGFRPGAQSAGAPEDLHRAGSGPGPGRGDRSRLPLTAGPARSCGWAPISFPS